MARRVLRERIRPTQLYLSKEKLAAVVEPDTYEQCWVERCRQVAERLDD
ncbi:MAG: hypothetical protein V5A55_04050 [Halovenus sp.]